MTRTFSTTNIVIMQTVPGESGIYAEDFSKDSRTLAYPARVARFIDPDHMRIFLTMREFTEWLHEMGAIVDECRVLTDTLTDEERDGRTA